MPKTARDYLDAANAAVPKIDVGAARALVADRNALIADVRDAPEVAKTGIASGAVNVSRGKLEYRANASSKYDDPAFRQDRPVILYCASGGRTSLAGKTLQEMGYGEVYVLGGLTDWQDGGGEVTPVGARPTALRVAVSPETAPPRAAVHG